MTDCIRLVLSNNWKFAPLFWVCHDFLVREEEVLALSIYAVVSKKIYDGCPWIRLNLKLELPIFMSLKQLQIELCTQYWLLLDKLIWLLLFNLWLICLIIISAVGVLVELISFLHLVCLTFRFFCMFSCVICWLCRLICRLLLFFLFYLLPFYVKGIICHEAVRLVAKSDLSTIDLNWAPPVVLFNWLDGLTYVVNRQVVNSIKLKESFCCVLETFKFVLIVQAVEVLASLCVSLEC